jgi:hypothetical protein
MLSWPNPPATNKENSPKIKKSQAILVARFTRLPELILRSKARDEICGGSDRGRPFELLRSSHWHFIMLVVEERSTIAVLRLGLAVHEANQVQDFDFYIVYLE